MPTFAAFGRAARPLWSLAPDASFLNHGSYGAVPRVVQAAQQSLRDELESHPDAFMARIDPTSAYAAVRAVASAVAPAIGIVPELLALIENATQGVQSALAAATLEPGDEVLVTTHQYNAVRLAVEERCHAAGALPRVVTVPVPTHADDIVERVLGAVTSRTRLAVLDHVTSPSAIVFPLERLLPEFRRREIPVIVDGAHAFGQLPLDLASLDADWYATNAHKWLYAPRGTALLVAADRVAARTRPRVISHPVGLGFPRAFDYVGTRDYTAWLTLPAALAFHRELQAAGLAGHLAALVDSATDALEEIGAVPVVPRESCAAMRAFVLPQTRAATATDATDVTRTLWQRERIQIRCAVVGDKLLLRLCGQAYVDADEMLRAGEAVGRHGWAARTAR